MTNPEWLGARARAVLRGLVPRSARKARAGAGAVGDGRAATWPQALRLDPAKVRVVSPHAAAVLHAGRGRRRAGARALRHRGLRAWRSATSGPRKNLGALGAAVREHGRRDRPPLALVGKPGPRRRADRAPRRAGAGSGTWPTRSSPTSTAPRR